VNCCDILIFSLFLFLQLLFPCFLIVSLTYKEKKENYIQKEDMVVYEKVKILQCKILVVNNEQKKIVKKKIYSDPFITK